MEKGMVVEESALKRGIGEPGEAISLPRRGEGRPDPQWVRGRCPECGDDLVSNLYYIGGKGYLLVWECWGSLGADGEDRGAHEGRCRYRRVL